MTIRWGECDAYLGVGMALGVTITIVCLTGVSCLMAMSGLVAKVRGAEDSKVLITS